MTKNKDIFWPDQISLSSGKAGFDAVSTKPGEHFATPVFFIPKEVAANEKAAEAMLPWICDALRRAYGIGRQDGIQEQRDATCAAIGVPTQGDLERLREELTVAIERAQGGADY